MKFTESHEWIEVEGGIGTVGVTEHAQKELGEVVFVELPQVGRFVGAGEEVAVLESTKAAADIYSPVSGEIVSVNLPLRENLEMLNNAPQAAGWLFKIKLSKASEVETLLDSKQYANLIS